MTNYLILGGSGFIGSNLARFLVTCGHCPRIYTRSSSSLVNITDILDYVDVVYGDFMDDVIVEKALDNIDVVFHLISTTFPQNTLESSVYDINSNLIPTIRLVEMCLIKGVKKIVYASSGGTVYGEPTEIPIKENHHLMPNSIYGQSKLTIENYLNFYARSTSLEVNILRISNPFGPRQKILGVQGLISVAMGCCFYRRPIKIFNKGEAVRDYLYIDDVVRALKIGAEISGSSIVNISSGFGYSIMEVIQLVEEVTQCTMEKIFVSARQGDVNVNILSNELARQKYGWVPQVDFKEGLSHTWDFILEHSAKQ
jgi:UDP-glucose 4-epimerase